MSKLDLNRAGRLMQTLRAVLACAILAIAAAPAAAFHFPWDQGHDTTRSNDPQRPGPDDRPENDPNSNPDGCRSPVFASLGHCFWSDVDIVLKGRPSIAIERHYNSNDPVVGLFGSGWQVSFDIALYPANQSGTIQRIYKAPNGKRFVFTRQANGTFLPPVSRFEVVTEGPTSVTMTSLDGRRDVFALDGRLLDRYDSNGNRLTFGYDATARPVRIQDGNGRFLAVTYNAASRVATITDHAGRVWRYDYDLVGNLTSVTNPAGGIRRYTYQGFRPPGDAFTYSQLTAVTDASGVVAVSFAYTGALVSSYTEGANRFTYTRPTSNTTLAGTVTRTDSLGAREIFVYGAKGLVTRDTDALNNVSNYVHDVNGRRTQTTDALGRVWRTTFDSLGRVTSTQNPIGQTTTIQYTGTDPRPIQITSPTGRIVRMVYDARGNLTSATDPSGAVSVFSVNPQGDVVSVQNALGQSTAVAYTATGLPLTVTDPLGRRSTVVYDALGRVSATTNAAGEVTRINYDALDRIVSVVDALGQTTAYSYDAAGRLTSVTDPKGSRTTYEHDSFGRRSAEVAPDGSRTTFGYRTDNLLDTVTWPGGATISYAYDANKRLIRETAGNEVATFAYNAVNQLLSATGPGGNVSFTYDAAGRLASETSGSQTSVFSRNAEGERTQLAALGRNIFYTRDVRGLVSQLATPAGNFDFSYDALGRRVGLSYPNLHTARYSFDGAGQQTALTHSGVLNAAFAHTFDPVGRITQMSGDGPNWNFSYDALGRLTSATQGASTYTYSLDLVGNILTGGRTYDTNHRLVSDATKIYSYDTRGNLVLEQDRTTGARVAYSWNNKNQLLNVAVYPDGATATPSRQLAFTYDPLGRRASRSDGGVVQRFAYDGNDLIGVLDSSGAIQSTNIFAGGIDENLASIDSAGVSKFYFADRLGSIRGVAQGGVLTHTYRYSPYGETVTPSSPDSALFRFTGREKDLDWLQYNRARYYHASMNRFISRDPIGLAGGINPYQYAGGNPISYRDPSGTILDTILDVGFILYDSYRILKDNVFGNCDNLGENLGALGADVAGALIPFATGGGAAVRAGSHADDVARAIKAGPNDGVIYRVPGDYTPSGKPYIGRTDDLAQRARNATDGRDRNQAEVIGTYPKGDVNAARRAEQQAINDHGGVPNLDNKRNEIAPSKWPDYGVK